MTESVLIISFLVFHCGYRFFSKKCSDEVMTSGRGGYALFLLINGLTTCAFFAVVSGFYLPLNGVTAWYAIIYALIVLVNSCLTLKAYHLAEVSTVVVIQSACSLITTSGVGCLLFSENLTAMKIICIVLMLIATFLSFFGTRKNEADSVRQKRKHTFVFLVVIILLIVTTSATTILMKYYTQDPNATSSNSLFFYLNVFLILPSVIWYAAERSHSPAPQKKETATLQIRRIVPMAAGTLCSNVTAIAQIRLLATIDVSVFTPISSAACIICGVVVSLLYREKLGFFQVASAIIATVAMLLS